ncbi:MAG: DUF559 domain-containing protein [Pseudomonadota bacterium]
MSALRQKARRLRKNMTEAEKRLWWYLREYFPKSHFRKQAPLGGYIVDFLSHSSKLIIEVDGGQHTFQGNLQKDKERQIWLESQGFCVVRFWNHDVFNNIQGVLEEISNFVPNPPTPNPSPPGGGEHQVTSQSSQTWEKEQIAQCAPSPLMGEGWGGGDHPTNTSQNLIQQKEGGRA